MKLNEMNVVITGANGGVESALMDYFSTRVAFVAGIINTASNRRQMPGANHGNWVAPDKIAEKVGELLFSDESGELVSL